jgi:rare lipoprotein A
MYTEQGIASWYGAPFHGRQASDGEVFDMNQLVAAHRTLPFGSRVRVTNLNNGKQIEVRIIDRGPFVSGRIIDLSLAAAQAIDMVGSGIVPVRIELVGRPSEPPAGAFAVQIGAFQERENADRLRGQLADHFTVDVQEFDAPGGRFYRVRVGRVATIAEAEQLASRLMSDGFMTFVVRLDGIQ